ncbi:MORN repeat-containing protein 3 isoform X3 [Rhinoderma darwinii]|uniref:MORN repeat-containing protein 3 isoform X3 n=1 Tax=Rhinoderma darwinii TaxID=43563 RepID=UPI003F67BE0C
MESGPPLRPKRRVLMPFVKYPRSIEPPWKDWDKKAQKSGLRHTVYSVNGDQYTGEWLNNQKHGKGTFVWKSTNSIYEGEWKSGKRSGFGTYSVQDPNTKEYVKVYSGCWKKDKKHGYGTYFYADKEYYEGDWEAGQRSGWGRMYFANGDIYEGEWREDKYCGQGMLRLGAELRLLEGASRDRYGFLLHLLIFPASGYGQIRLNYLAAADGYRYLSYVLNDMKC